MNWLSLLAASVVLGMPSVSPDNRYSQSQLIPSGNYWWKPTGSVLVVKGDRYRYEYDDGSPSDWRLIGTLKPLKRGVVLDKQGFYWCLSTLPSYQVGSSCSPDGFVK